MAALDQHVQSRRQQRLAFHAGVIALLVAGCGGGARQAELPQRSLDAADLLRLSIRQLSPGRLAIVATLENTSNDQRLWINHKMYPGPFGNLTIYALHVATGGKRCRPRPAFVWESGARAAIASDYLVLGPRASVSKVVAIEGACCETQDALHTLPEGGFRIVAEYQDRPGDEIVVPEFEVAIWFSGKITSNEVEIVPNGAVAEALKQGACGQHVNLGQHRHEPPEQRPSP